MYAVITEVKWAANIQQGEGTARDKGHLDTFLLPDSEQIIIFGPITKGHVSR